MFTAPHDLRMGLVHPFWTRLNAVLEADRRRSFEKRSINQLQELDDRLLRDLGLTRADADHARPRTLQEIGV